MHKRKFKPQQQFQTPLMAFYCFKIPYEILNEIGYFDKTFGKCGGEDIDYRIDRYTKCISRSTYNFVDWLKDDYRKKLRAFLRDNFDTMFEEIHGRPAE